jgi:hypothetical protein
MKKGFEAITYLWNDQLGYRRRQRVLMSFGVCYFATGVRHEMWLGVGIWC